MVWKGVPELSASQVCGSLKGLAGGNVRVMLMHGGNGFGGWVITFDSREVKNFKAFDC